MALSRLKLLMVALALSPGMCIVLGQAGEWGRSANAVSRGGAGYGFRRGSTYPSGLPLTALTRAARRPSASVVPQGVRRQVPQEYATIQAAIDTSVDGDTVLVSEGIFYENIRYRGKAITVASLYLIDGDSTHIEKTIIDGSHSTDPDSCSVVYFVDGEDTTSVLCGFTIRGGTGTNWQLESNLVRSGGGVFCDSAGARIVRNRITGNRVVAPYGFGGGVEATGTILFLPHVILEANRITDNYAEGTEVPPGGASGSGGADISGVDARVIDNVFERDTAICNAEAYGGGMTLRYAPGRFPPAYVGRNIFRSNFVMSPQLGANGGGLALYYAGQVTVEQNLFEANTAFAKGMTGGATGGGMIVVGWNDSGASRKSIVNNRFLNNRVECPAGGGYGSGGGLYVDWAVVTISDNTFRGNNSTGGRDANAGALFVYGSSFRLEGNLFTQNASSSGGPGENAGGGGAVFLVPEREGCEQLIANNIFFENSATAGGGAISMWDGSEGEVPLYIVNNTIIGNASAHEGGGIHFGNKVDVLFMNNIVWENRSAGSYHQISNYSSLGLFLHNDIMGGWPLGTGNISVPPLFAGSTYRLTDSSYCIGAGLDSVFFNHGWFCAPDRDIDDSNRPGPPGSHPDVGACESPLHISIKASALSVTPRLCDFHNVRPGTVSDTIGIAVANRDTLPRQILSLSPLESEFAFCPAPVLPLAIPPQSQTEIKLVYSPASPGETIVDTLVIETTDRYYATKTVVLRGRGSDSVRCAQSGALYGISGSSGVPTMHEIDRQTGRVKTSEEVSPQAPQGVRALTIRRRDNMLYAAFPSSSGTDVYRISSQFGDFEPFGSIPLADVTSMTYSPADVLYLVTAATKMYRAADGTADTVFVGSTGHAFTGLAFSPATGLLWASIRDSVFKVDPATGMASLVGWSNWQAPHSSIAFNPLGTLYGVFGTWLVMIERVWAMPTELGQMGEADLVAIAMRSDPVTEALEDMPDLPRETLLSQNYPNPFNPTTVIRYVIGESTPVGRDASIGGGAGNVRLAVYDILGREVALLVEERKAPGNYETSFDGTGLSSGVYLYRLQCGSYVTTKRMILMK